MPWQRPAARSVPALRDRSAIATGRTGRTDRTAATIYGSHNVRSVEAARARSMAAAARPVPRPRPPPPPPRHARAPIHSFVGGTMVSGSSAGSASASPASARWRPAPSRIVVALHVLRRADEDAAVDSVASLVRARMAAGWSQLETEVLVMAAPSLLPSLRARLGELPWDQLAGSSMALALEDAPAVQEGLLRDGAAAASTAARPAGNRHDLAPPEWRAEGGLRPGALHSELPARMCVFEGAASPAAASPASRCACIYAGMMALIGTLERTMRRAASRGAYLLWLTPWSLVRADPTARLPELSGGLLSLMAQPSAGMNPRGVSAPVSAAVMLVPPSETGVLSGLLDAVRADLHADKACRQLDVTYARCNLRMENLLDNLLSAAAERHRASLRRIPGGYVSWARRGVLAGVVPSSATAGTLITVLVH